jgi:methionyl-tRNA formyltransferase
MDANEILNFIYAVGFPFLGASTCFNDQKIRIFDAEIIKDVKIINRDVGKVIFFDERFPVIVCGKGLLKISDAIYDHNKLTIFPLNNFRIRFL